MHSDGALCFCSLLTGATLMKRVTEAALWPGALFVYGARS